MTNDEFIDAMVGVPWKDRACSFMEVDCVGLIILYYRHVMGIELPEFFGFADGSLSIAEGFELDCNGRKWGKDDAGIVFMSFVKIGGARAPVHCGVIIGDMCLHSMGSNESPGQVTCNKLNSIKRLYKGDIERYKYVG